MKWIFSAVGLLGAGAAGLYAYQKYNRNLQAKKRTEQETAYLAAGLQRHKEDFTGLYELMYQISIGHTENASGTWGEWCLRIENLDEDMEFSNWFLKKFDASPSCPEEKCASQAGLIIKALEECGIHRDCREVITADKKTLLRYILLGEGFVIPGQTYRVFSPCWALDGQVLEKGILKEHVPENKPDECQGEKRC